MSNQRNVKDSFYRCTAMGLKKAAKEIYPDFSTI